MLKARCWLGACVANECYQLHMFRVDSWLNLSEAKRKNICHYLVAAYGTWRPRSISPILIIAIIEDNCFISVGLLISFVGQIDSSSHVLSSSRPLIRLAGQRLLLVGFFGGKLVRIWIFEVCAMRFDDEFGRLIDDIGWSLALGMLIVLMFLISQISGKE